jgi:pyridinium-3,5-biscarboxylic acid mononucleotide synthase
MKSLRTPLRHGPASTDAGGIDTQELTSIAEKLLVGTLSPDEFAAIVGQLLKTASSPAAAELSTATLDLDRRRRCGFPEVVYGPGKTAEQLCDIVTKLVAHGEDVFITRVSLEQAGALISAFPRGRHNAVGRTFRLPQTQNGAESTEQSFPVPRVAVISAGTSDQPVVEEVRETLDWMGVQVTLVQDVGVAGPHRLPERLAEFQDADAIVVVAGMEGALPSIVGGYVPCPVIGVPTSVGYGANFGGVAPLLSMLNSCASNVTVVNIDAGFKAAYVAGLIATRRHERAE